MYKVLYKDTIKMKFYLIYQLQNVDIFAKVDCKR